MLKKRIITLLTLNDGVLFRTKNFRPDYRYTLNFVDLDHVDEVVILDVTPEGEGDRGNFYRTLREFTEKCQVPLAVGGKIANLDEVSRLFGEFPVEKVVVESGLVRNPDLGRQIAEKWGRQALCAGITRFGGLDEWRWTMGHLHLPRYCEHAGEILYQSVEHDGSLLGYDMECVRDLVWAFDCPVIAGSGCGTWKHMKEAFEAGADACATSCIHHFPASQIRACKQYLHDEGIPVRL